MKLIQLLCITVWFHWSCLANELNKRQWSSWQQSPQWTPASTQYWAGTTAYQSTWVGISTSTVYVYITQQANVVVTITSYIPCVVTSTTWVYQCQGGCPTATQSQPGAIGTVTVTSYAQVTGPVQLVTRTVTSGSYVLAIIEAASATAQNQISNVASQPSLPPAVVPVAAFVAVIFSLMLWL